MEKKILLKNLTEKMDKVLLNLEHDFGMDCVQVGRLLIF